MTIKYVDELGHNRSIMFAVPYGKVGYSDEIHISWKHVSKQIGKPKDTAYIFMIDLVLYHPEYGIVNIIECDTLQDALSKLYNLPDASGVWQTWTINVLCFWTSKELNAGALSELTIGTE